MKYKAKITIQGKETTKRLVIPIEAENDSDATSKAWQRISVTVESDEEKYNPNQMNVFGMLNDIMGGKQ